MKSISKLLYTLLDNNNKLKKLNDYFNLYLIEILILKLK